MFVCVTAKNGTGVSLYKRTLCPISLPSRRDRIPVLPSSMISESWDRCCSCTFHHLGVSDGCAFLSIQSLNLITNSRLNSSMSKASSILPERYSAMPM